MIQCKKGDIAIEGTMAELVSEYGTIRHYLKEAKKKMAHVRAYQKKNGHEEIYDYYRVEKSIYIVRK